MSDVIEWVAGDSDGGLRLWEISVHRWRLGDRSRVCVCWAERPLMDLAHLKK